MPTQTAPWTVTLRRLVLARDGAGLTDGQLLGEFVRTADPAAFEGLVRRHGAMVLGVCRRVVGDRHVAEDAFQAVWVVLARRAATVRPRDHVGNWLFGVAYRTALKARGILARRYAREKQVTTMPHPEAPTTAAAWTDVAPVIDAELAQLPDELRLPVVLCDLEGRTQREAARHLGLPVTTLVNRLAKARRTLAKRLAERGVALSGGALAGVLGTYASAQAVPHTLTAAAVAGATAGTASAAALHLSEGVLRMMVLAKLKPATTTVLAAIALSLGLGTAVLPTAAGQDSASVSAKPPLAKAGAIDDDAFLCKACTDIRGTPATDLERALFKLDADAKKRTKVVEWLLSDAVAQDPKPALDREVSTALVEWILLADGSVRNHTATDRGVDWLQSYRGEITNLNDLTRSALAEKPTYQQDRKHQPPAPPPAEDKQDPSADRKRAERTARRIEQLYLQMEATKYETKREEAARARAELAQARADVEVQRANLDRAEAEQKRTADGAKIDADLAKKIDREVARAHLAQARARLDRLAAFQAEAQKASSTDRQMPSGFLLLQDESTFNTLARLWTETSDDASFLHRVLLDTLGVPPTALGFLTKRTHSA